MNNSESIFNEDDSPLNIDTIFANLSPFNLDLLGQLDDSTLSDTFVEPNPSPNTLHDPQEYSNGTNTVEASPINDLPSLNETNNDYPNNVQCIEALVFIEQPSHGSRFRYRSDLQAAPTRKEYLKTKSQSTIYKAPAIRIPMKYLNADGSYGVLVTIATPLLNEPGAYAFHNYDIEDPVTPNRYHQFWRGVFYEMSEADADGNLLFKSLRIIKRRNADLERMPIVKLFDYEQSNGPYSATAVSWKIVILVCVVVRYHDENRLELLNQSVVYSEPMIEGSQSNPISPEQNSNDSQVPFNTEDPNKCRIYKYAPKYGCVGGNEDIIVMLTKRPEMKKFGDIKAYFIFDQNDPSLNQLVQVSVKDSCAMILTPPHPNRNVEINESVNVQLYQGNRTIGDFNYIYIPAKEVCSKCISNALNPNLISVTPMKRSRSNILYDHTENDSVKSKEEKLLERSAEEGSVEQKLMSRMQQMFRSLYVNDDITHVLNFSKSFIKNDPQIIFDAISKEDNVWIFTFLRTAKLDILQSKDGNQNTVLIHAVRHNSLKTIQVLGENKYFPEIVADMDSDKNTAFHLLAKNREKINLLDVLLGICKEKQIDMKAIMGKLNKEMKTALQVSIYQNNIEATKRLSEFLSVENHIRIQETGDNLVHLAVRFADLSMVTFLIEDKALTQQGNETNFHMTPQKLAESLDKMQLADYLKEKYPVSQLQENESDSQESEDETD